MFYHVSTGAIDVKVEAPTLDDAFIKTLRTVPLENCSMLICGYEDGKKLDDWDTQWALTEWYLERAGYEKVKDGLWRKNRTTGSGSDGNSGYLLKKVKSVPTLKPLKITYKRKRKPILKTDSTTPFKQDGKQQPIKQEKKDSYEPRRASTPNPIVKVETKRTPEEWNKILEEARSRK